MYIVVYLSIYLSMYLPLPLPLLSLSLCIYRYLPMVRHHAEQSAMAHGRICVCACVYVCMCLCVYVCARLRTSAYVRIGTRLFCMCACTYACKFACPTVCIRMLSRALACTYACLCTHTQCTHGSFPIGLISHWARF